MTNHTTTSVGHSIDTPRRVECPKKKRKKKKTLFYPGDHDVSDLLAVP